LQKLVLTWEAEFGTIEDPDLARFDHTPLKPGQIIVLCEILLKSISLSNFNHVLV
jgi:hypothetical protein